jgi:flagella basal body P-ring formation protein FlgA
MMRLFQTTWVLAGCLIAAPLWAQQVTAKVPVFVNPVGKDVVVMADMLTEADVAAQSVLPGIVASATQVVGLQTVRPIPAGQPLNKLHFKVRPVVMRGAPVVVRYVKGGVELTMQGQALEDGQMNDTVKVTNPGTRTPLVGRVTAPGVVTLK